MSQLTRSSLCLSRKVWLHGIDNTVRYAIRSART